MKTSKTERVDRFLHYAQFTLRDLQRRRAARSEPLPDQFIDERLRELERDLRELERAIEEERS